MRSRYSLLSAAVAAALLGTAGAASAQISIGVSVHIAPPVLPVYAQPVMPDPGYLWVPGYWAWNDDSAFYYWVPGTWVEPPEPGLLWTPGYWGWTEGAYIWHEGYWGPHVGFYGGVDYGFGYGPRGYDGGYWNHGQFYYNTAVTRVGPGMHLAYTYNHPVIGGSAPGRVSFNGGRGGVQVHATPAQITAGREHHVMPIGAQRELVNSASHDQRLRANFNHGHPGVTATARPEAFTHQGGEAARIPEHGAHVEGGRGPSREVPQEHQGQPGANHGFAPGNERRPQSNESHPQVNQSRPQVNEARPQTSESHAPQGNAHAAPNFAPREHVPVAPRGETHAAPAGGGNAPHGGNAHPGAPHAPQHEGGGKSGDHDHPQAR